MTDSIHGAKGGSSTPHAATEAPDSLHSIAYARILDLVSEGEILGFKHGAANALQDIYLNETPIANADNSLNFKNVQIDTRTGTQSQGYMPGYPDVENETAVGLELTSSTAWTQSFTDITLSAVRIRLSVPSLQQSNTSTGDITGYTIQYKVELQTDSGSFVTMLTSAFTGKTTSKYERSHRIDLPTATTGWVLRITRLTANAHLATISDTTTIESYTAIVDAKFRYPNSALVGVIIDASQFQSIPTRAYDLYGRIISVPTNYDPVARTYTGTWDGTFKPAWTNNPAWIFYDLATNTRYGLGNYVSAALLNKWALYSIAQYCDGSVSNGFGGTEPRFTCNLYLQAQADAYKVLQDLASVFRGMVYWAGGAIQVVADMPADPVYTYTQANVISGKFTYQGSGRKTRFTTALVSWNDPQDFGRAKVEYVPDGPGIARYGIQPTSITGFGCTSQAQAHRLGLWVLLTSRLETETGIFATGLDGTIAAPGQIVRVADSARAGKRQGGRISSATTTAVTVDAAPTVAIGDTLTCTMPTGVTETHTVSAVAGNVITVGSAFSVAPLREAAWVVESTALAAQTFRMLSVLEDGTGPNLSFSVTALSHNASKFAAIDAGAPITVPNVTAIPPSSQIGPATVSLSSAPTAGAVVASTLLTVQWSATANAVWYEVDLRKDNGDWQPLGKQLGLSVDVPSVKAGSYTARVRAVNASGIGSVPTVSSALAVADQTMQPTTVTTLQTEVATAQSSANAANAELANIASDGIVSAAEKPTVIRDWSVISSEQAGIDAQAVSFLGATSAQQVAYDNAITTLATYLGALTSPKMWNDKTGDTTVVGATFRANFNSVYVTRQTLLNAIYAKAQTLANNAQGTANTANTSANTAVGQVTQLPVINGGFDIAPTGYGWTPDSGTGWITDTGSNSPGVQPNCARHTGTSSPTTGAYRNNGLAPCQPGQTYKTQALIKAVGANGICYVYISWCNAAGGEIGTTIGNTVTGTTTAGSYAVGQAPAGTVFARTCLAYSGQTAGDYFVDNVVCTQYPSNIDEVPDGPINARTLATRVNAGNPLIDFSAGYHLNKNLSNVADAGGRYAAIQANADNTASNTSALTASLSNQTQDALANGPTYGRALNTRLNSGNPLIDFAAGYHLNKNIDNLADGVNHVRGVALSTSEVVDNANFELPLNADGSVPGWKPFGTGQLYLYTAAPYQGSQSLQINCPAQYDGAESIRKYACTAGDVFLVKCALASNAGGYSKMQVRFYNGSGTAFSSVDTASSTFAFQVLSATVTIPSGAVYFTIVFHNDNTGGGGVFYVDTVTVARLRSIDSEVSDGTIFGRTVQSRLSSGVPFIDFAAGIHLNKNIDNVADGTTFARVSTNAVTGGNIDFAKSGFANKTVDNVGDGTTYARIKGTELSSGVHKLGVAGSGALLGNQLNAPNSLTLNYGASRTATAVTATSAGVVSINAFTFKMGGAAVSYNAVSNAVSGLTVGVTYQIYCHDAGGTGGTKTWYAVAGTQTDALSISDDVVIAGQVTIPSSGSSGGGGTGCPVVGAWVIRRTIDGPAWAQAGDVVVGDELLLTSGDWGRVSHSRKVLQPCVQVRDENGFTLSCSSSAPLGRTDGSQVLAPDAEGELIESRTGMVKGSSRVAGVRDIGEQWVQHITCENDFYWVGDQTDRLFSHHNLKP